MFKAACGKLGWTGTQRRVAQLTQMLHNRPPCHYCGNCVNGCDVGAMFSTISSTLPPALKTGNVTLLCYFVVSHVLMDGENRARGVRYIDRHTKHDIEIGARAGGARRVVARKYSPLAELTARRPRQQQRSSGA